MLKLADLLTEDSEKSITEVAPGSPEEAAVNAYLRKGLVRYANELLKLLGDPGTDSYEIKHLGVEIGKLASDLADGTDNSEFMLRWKV
mgnify:CR=1 FL=1